VGARVSPQSFAASLVLESKGDEYGDDVAACWVRCSEWISDGGLRGESRDGAGPQENTGTVAGVVGGAVVGSQFGRGAGRVRSTVAGAATAG